MDSLSDRLKALGFKVASNIEGTNVKRQIPLEKAISGRVIANSLGEYVIKDNVFPAGYQHGNVEFPETIYTRMISSASKMKGQTPELSDLLFLDTETSGLAAGAGSFAFLVGIGKFSAEGFVLRQFIIRDPGEESAMLLDLYNAISPGTVFVTFNGKSFDIPLLESRYRINKLPVTLSQNPHLDLLQLSRRIWRKRLESCALKDLEKEILLFPRTDDDVPGWMIPDIYFEFLRTKNTDKLSNVIYHNAQDVVSLAALFIHLSNLLENQQGIKHVDTLDQFSIARIYYDIGNHDIAEKICLNLLSNQLSEKETIEISKFLGAFYKKLSRFDDAERHWITAAKLLDFESCIELAMVAEHRKKDYQEAIYWVDVSKSCITNANKSLTEKFYVKRLERLIDKEKRNVQSKN